MNNITVEELEKKDMQEGVVIDIRSKADYLKGSFSKAIHIPIEKFEENMDTIPKEKNVYVLCHTGEKSQDIVEQLEEHGNAAYNIEGGYRSY